MYTRWSPLSSRLGAFNSAENHPVIMYDGCTEAARAGSPGRGFWPGERGGLCRAGGRGKAPRGKGRNATEQRAVWCLVRSLRGPGPSLAPRPSAVNVTKIDASHMFFRLKELSALQHTPAPPGLNPYHTWCPGESHTFATPRDYQVTWPGTP